FARSSSSSEPKRRSAAFRRVPHHAQGFRATTFCYRESRRRSKHNVRFGSFAADALCLSTGFCPLLLQEPTNAGAAGVSAKFHKQTHALQYDRRKQKDRQCGGLSEIRPFVLIGRNRNFACSLKPIIDPAANDIIGELGVYCISSAK